MTGLSYTLKKGVKNMFTKGLVAYSKGESRYIQFALEQKKEADAKREFAKTSKQETNEQTAKENAFKLMLSEEAKKTMGSDGKSEQTAEEDKEPITSELWRKGKTKEEQRQIETQIRVLQRNDTKVKAHEQSHKSVGGQYAGAINYQRTTGPDGKQYVVGGEVSISTSDASTPRETSNKMQIVRRAALAPPDPSSQDKSVAAMAQSKESRARVELNEESREKAKEISEKSKVYTPETQVDTEKMKEYNYKVFKDTKAKKQEDNLGSYVDLSA